jgi:hypothetical protein
MSLNPLIRQTSYLVESNNFSPGYELHNLGAQTVQQNRVSAGLMVRHTQ